jgi:hypothetical protein
LKFGGDEMNLKLSAYIVAASICLALFLTESASGSSMLPDAYADFVLTLNNTNQGFFNYPLLTPSASATLGSGSFTAIGTASLTPSPMITGTASLSANGLAESYTSFSYFFEVVAPTSESAHLIFAASARLSAGGQMPNIASLVVGNGGPNLVSAYACSGNCPSTFPYPPTFNVNTPITVTTGVPYQVQEVLALVSQQPQTPFVADYYQHGFIDPVITFDKNFASTGETLAFSQGVGNSPVSPVPLPSTWGMMLMGLIGLGFIAHRQKSKPTALDGRLITPPHSPALA